MDLSTLISVRHFLFIAEWNGWRNTICQIVWRFWSVLGPCGEVTMSRDFSPSLNGILSQSHGGLLRFVLSTWGGSWMRRGLSWPPVPTLPLGGQQRNFQAYPDPTDVFWCCRSFLREMQDGKFISAQVSTSGCLHRGTTDILDQITLFGPLPVHCRVLNSTPVSTVDAGISPLHQVLTSFRRLWALPKCLGLKNHPQLKTTDRDISTSSIILFLKTINTFAQILCGKHLLGASSRDCYITSSRLVILLEGL